MGAVEERGERGPKDEAGADPRPRDGQRAEDSGKDSQFPGRVGTPISPFSTTSRVPFPVPTPRPSTSTLHT